MIPPVNPCAAPRYFKIIIKICEWVKSEKSAVNQLYIVSYGIVRRDNLVLVCNIGITTSVTFKNVTPSDKSTGAKKILKKMIFLSLRPEIQFQLPMEISVFENFQNYRRKLVITSFNWKFYT